MANPIVKVLEGELEGRVITSSEGNSYYSFLGIPFAEPPVKELRFKPPVPKKPWSGVRDASKEGEACAQSDLILNQYVGSEDCLYLNIATPRLPRQGEDELLPVMFYIHGGGFVSGSGSFDWFGPDFIVERDTILVTANYRLGALGFLCLDIPGAPGNVGLRDQTLALKWVQQNIRVFNGDPDNVTVFGISAGAASVEYHLLSSMSEGLFQKAILQSGSALNPWARSRNPAKLVSNLAKTLGSSKTDPEECLKFLQNIEVKKLVEAARDNLDDEDIKNGEMFAFAPVVEKKMKGIESFLCREPLELLNAGKFIRVPTITGFCENEGGPFKQFYHKHVENLTKRNFIEYLPSSFEVDRVHYALKLNEIYDQKSDLEAVDCFLGDLGFLGGIHHSLHCRLRNNHLENYLYMFTYDGNLNFVKKAFNIKEKGAYHGDDTTYLGSCKYVSEGTPTAKDILVRNRMVQMWTDFARNGNTTPEQTNLITTEWLPVTCHHTVLLEIGEDVKMNKMPFSQRIGLWESLYNTNATILD